MDIKADFYVVAKERGSLSLSLPTWANKTTNVLDFDKNASSEVRRVEVPEVPGAFQLLNVFSTEETARFIEVTEALGYTEDAAVSLPRSIRHNNNLTWVIDDVTHEIIWERVRAFMEDKQGIYENKKPLGINQRFRFYKYDQGDFFKIHKDGAWSGSAVINKELVYDAYPDRFSQMTFLILLSEDFEGGETQFLVDKNDVSRPAKNIQEGIVKEIRTPIGGVLCFPHGLHPLHCLHSSALIESGIKYIIRTDVLFQK